MSLHLGAIQQGQLGFSSSVAKVGVLLFPEQQLVSLGERWPHVSHVNQ